MVPPQNMDGKLNVEQERRWFYTETGLLVFCYLLTGAVLAGIQWNAKLVEIQHSRRMQSPHDHDPGVTPAEDVDTTHAIPVTAGVYLERIQDLSIRDTSWTAEFDLWFRWKGDLLLSLDKLVVVDGAIESRDVLAESHDGEQHYRRYRIVAKVTKHFSVTHFPLDEHLLTLSIENGGARRQDLLFVADLENTGTSSRVKVPGYRLLGWHLLEKPHSYQTSLGDPRLVSGSKSTYSQLRFCLPLKRAGMGLYFKMFQALYVAVAIALLAYFIKPIDLDPRFGLGVGALFAAVANSYLVGSYVPDMGELALADLVNCLGIMTILLTLIESTVSLHLYDPCQERALSARLDWMSFRVTLIGFITINVLLLLPSLN
jgi:hypothetical protein